MEKNDQNRDLNPYQCKGYLSAPKPIYVTPRKNSDTSVGDTFTMNRDTFNMNRDTFTIDRNRDVEWSTGLFSCFDDMYICCKVLFFCPCTSINLNNKLKKKSFTFVDSILSIFLCPFTYSLIWCCQSCIERDNRIIISYKFNKKNNNNLCTSIFCLPCMICQDWREFNHITNSIQV